MRTRVRGPRDREDVEGWMKAILSMVRRDSSGELLRLITCVLAGLLGRTGRTLGGLMLSWESYRSRPDSDGQSVQRVSMAVRPGALLVRTPMITHAPCLEP
jgi:hypothetical protein